MTVAVVTPGATPSKSRIRTIVIWLVVLIVLGALANLLGWNIRWLARRGVGHDHNDLDGQPRCCNRRQDPGDDGDSVRLVLDPPLRLSGRSALATRPRPLRSISRTERHPPCEPRHARPPDHAHADDLASAAFAGILGAYGVEKIFFCVIGLVPYLYLFLTVGGSFDIKFGSSRSTQRRS
jgi:hypothetical protein